MAKVEFKESNIEKTFSEMIVGTYFRIPGNGGIHIKSSRDSFLSLTLNSLNTSVSQDLEVIEIPTDRVVIQVYQ